MYGEGNTSTGTDAEQLRRGAVTLILCVINIAIFLLEELSGGSDVPNVAIRFGAMYRPLIRNGEWWRLLTSMFVHFNISHIFTNMISLVLIGTTLEAQCGHVRFLVFYVTGGLAGNLLSFFAAGDAKANVVTAGASGAVFAILGAYLALAIIWRRNYMARGNLVLAFAAVGYMFIRSMGADVDTLAHLGGLLAGFGLGILLCRSGGRGNSGKISVSA
jgi:rhomboid protease GluP